MTPRLPLLAALAIATASPADAATRTFTITGFDRIRVDGPYRVKLATGVAPFARAEGSAAALEAVSLDVEGRTLIIRRKSAAHSNRAQRPGPVAISVGTHELAAAWLNGAGGLAIDKVKGQRFDLAVSGSGSAEVGALAVDRLNLSVSGTAKVALGGAAESANLSIRGASSVDASALTAKSASIATSGAATVSLTASDTARVESSGLATIALAGEPACTISPASSAEISGCR